MIQSDRAFHHIMYFRFLFCFIFIQNNIHFTECLFGQTFGLRFSIFDEGYHKTQNEIPSESKGVPLPRINSSVQGMNGLGIYSHSVQHISK